MREPAVTRQYWLDVLCQISEPVLHHLSNRTLKQNMPVISGFYKERDRILYTYLEALGRSLAGMAPWLELGPGKDIEGKLRQRFANLAREAIDAGTDPDSPDFMNFGLGNQPIVDAAFLSHAILRAPTELWEKLDGSVQNNLVRALKLTRSRKPGFNNWLLFSAIIECALYRMGEDWDRMRVDYALRQHEQWYKGDGVYGDGPEFHWDYYNSFVIQPMLLDILDTVGHKEKHWIELIEPVKLRAQRYAEVLERMISPEGTIPPIGRSLAYRFGALQHLGQMALRDELPSSLSMAQVRCAMSAVINRMMEFQGNFDKNGWLQIGFCGSQMELGEPYISTGSLYLCLTGLLPLGLSEQHAFWTDPDEEWTSQKIWSGKSAPMDKAL
ncbi:DUF2264 domain-containing protein [Chengkuizengella axinellae]|uniref:DUF2264 domain-containing protein n=1 Tax=Chengkuizengella axinellae TaxID=3064388 RepID=A0ABT9J2X5_9BACL|nr:DUF2264 domain-containing protein [Chengkuizengella sp. 2205SS18-9]MDP5275930.1 DUF2264 domain-containing protein [Chengkuizengella sp. 2205SS18-9]